MHRRDYCVYNQTNECFLSLGATLGTRPLARFKQWLGIDPYRADEGCWINPQEARPSLGFFSPRDLVYIDANHCVVHLIKAFPPLHTVPLLSNAEGILALPVHSISSSQTRAGHQLLICAPDEMEAQLRILQSERSHAPEPASPVIYAVPVPQPPNAVLRKPPAVVSITASRPSAMRIPSHVAYYTEDGKLAVHAVRDLCESGFYLVTRDRWPIGAEVKMSLPLSSGMSVIDDKTASPITVCMRVNRWGADGVGLEFDGTAAEAADLKSLNVC